MKIPTASLFLVAVIALAAACNRSIIVELAERQPKDARAALVGHYTLHVGTGQCAGRGISRSSLTLYSDGHSEQRDVFSDSSEFVTNGTWQYEDGNIAINKLRIMTTGEIDQNASPKFASLIVDWSHPPNILLNPHSDCFFAKQDGPRF